MYSLPDIHNGITTLFHNEVHQIEEVDRCSKPSLQTFVDDLLCTIKRIENIPL